MDIAQILQAAQKVAVANAVQQVVSGTLGGASASSSAAAPAVAAAPTAIGAGALASLLGGSVGANPALASLGTSAGANPALASLGTPAGTNPALASLTGSAGANAALASLAGSAGANAALASLAGPAGANSPLASLAGSAGASSALASLAGSTGASSALASLTAGANPSASTGSASAASSASTTVAALSKVAAADPATALVLASAQQKLAQQQSTLESLQRLQKLQSLQLQQVLAEQQQKQEQLQLLAGRSSSSDVGAGLGAALSAAVNAAAAATATRPVVGAAGTTSSPARPGPVVGTTPAVSASSALPAPSGAAALLAKAAAAGPSGTASLLAKAGQPAAPALAAPAPVHTAVPAAQPSGLQPGNALLATKRSPEEPSVQERVAKVKAAREAKAKAEAEAKQKKQEEEVTKCHLHKKPKSGCKFCRRHEEYQKDQARKASAAASSFGRQGALHGMGNEEDQRRPIEIANTKTYGFSTLVQTHIQDSHYYQSILGLQTFEQLVEEAAQYAKSVEPYMPDSTVMPTPFICLVHRLFTLSLDGNQMFQLLDNTESPYIRCLGFVYLRFGLHTDRLWGWLGEYVLDDEEFQPSQGAGQEKTTIGEFVEELLSKEKYYGALLPRVTGAVRRQLEEKLAPVAQSRKRTWANRGCLDSYRQKGTRIEACIEGIWHDGTVMELIEDFPSRLKVLVKINGGLGAEEFVHLGKVILRDSPPWGLDPKKVDKRARSRSRSRDRVDWSRNKGKSDEDLVEELRRGARERAVCTSGKDYSRRPTTFDKGLAQPREGQGVAARRLLEEETIVKVSAKKRRSPSPASRAKPKEVSEEQKQRMQKLFEKYGNVKPTEAPKASDDDGGPDVLRLG